MMLVYTVVQTTVLCEMTVAGVYGDLGTVERSTRVGLTVSSPVEIGW